MNPRKFLLVLFAALALVTLSGCTSPDPYVNQGRVAGGLIGAGAGAIIGNNTGLGTLGGAAIGGALGAIMGDTAGKTNSMYYGGRYR
ncbi:MAG: hypothetical protein AAGD22_17790 [Verrucomicrobiota bacterium]